ncbi:carboxylate--amine ligase [Actinomadura macrotermitis]|uniref:carboxylate--amine ligase n=1 Tax=Actinomadura macrotermitis TaxID=2585200 RepID=UPI002E2558F3
MHAGLGGRAEPCTASRYLCRQHPVEPKDERDLLLRLNIIARRIGRRALLVPLDDAGAVFAAEHSAALAKEFVLSPPTPWTPRSVADKSELHRRCRALGIPTAESHFPDIPEEADAVLGRLGFPCVAKWARPWLLPSGQRSTMLVTGRAQAHRLLAGTAGPAGPLILQRYIAPGAGDWFFHGYFDDGGRCLFGGAGRKHVSYPAHTGHTVAGEWVCNPELEAHAHAVAARLGIRGVVDMDFRRDGENGDYALLDCNPRLGAQFRLFSDRGGLDLARVVHLAASGRAVPEPRPAYGRTIVVEQQYLQSSLRSPDALAHVRRFRDAHEFAWYAPDDLAPFVALGRRAASKAIGRAVRSSSALAQRARAAKTSGGN